MEYRIPEINMPKLKEKLAKIERKCKRYGCDFSFAEKSVEYEEITDAETNQKKLLCFYVVDVSGTSVINNWQFIATIDHTQNGNILRGYADGVEIPERYYNADCFCEHCKTVRRRNNSYIVRNTETGEFKQVGKNCLLDYTHGLSAENVADYLSYFREIEKSVQYDGAGFLNSVNYIARDEFLGYVAETIRCFGYESKVTAGKSVDYYDAVYNRFPFFLREYREKLLEEMDKVHFNINREDTKKMVADAVAWIETQEEKSNYIHNLKVACSLDYVKPEHYNLLASLFPAYSRELEYMSKKAQEKEIEKTSDYIGNVGDRITVKICSCKAVASYETLYGITKIYKMVDENGNVIVWKTGNTIDAEKFTITGTVKEHKTFRDVKQTELTRCRITENK